MKEREKMKIIKFKGGLGNQIFQYSFLRSLQVIHKQDNVYADFSYYDDIEDDEVRLPRIEKLNVNLTKAKRTDLSNACMFSHEGNPISMKYKAKIYIEKIINKKYYFEKNRSYRNPEILLDYKYYDGYWQSWRYFQKIEKELRSELSLKSSFSEKTKSTIKKVRSEDSVFIGIRRGDYLESKKNMKHFGVFDEKYFKKAIKIIEENVENPVFYIFSNDISWVKNNMNFECNTVYRESEDQVSDVEELHIMGSCKHAIIVNSTFYWWGAWLIKNRSKIIIAPKKWFADGVKIDIVPPSWIRV